MQGEAGENPALSRNCNAGNRDRIDPGQGEVRAPYPVMFGSLREQGEDASIRSRCTKWVSE